MSKPFPSEQFDLDYWRGVSPAELHDIHGIPPKVDAGIVEQAYGFAPDTTPVAELATKQPWVLDEETRQVGKHRSAEGRQVLKAKHPQVIAATEDRLDSASTSSNRRHDYRSRRSIPLHILMSDDKNNTINS